MNTPYNTPQGEFETPQSIRNEMNQILQLVDQFPELAIQAQKEIQAKGYRQAINHVNTIH